MQYSKIYCPSKISWDVGIEALHWAITALRPTSPPSPRCNIEIHFYFFHFPLLLLFPCSLFWFAFLIFVDHWRAHFPLFCFFIFFIFSWSLVAILCQPRDRGALILFLFFPSFFPFWGFCGDPVPAAGQRWAYSFSFSFSFLFLFLFFSFFSF